MIICYGICGPGEASRHLRETLDEFKRLGDKTIILGNKLGNNERNLILEYGFQIVEDNREWGINQWRIKQDFANRYLAKIAKEGDMMVCLDMDETFCKHLTKEWLETAPLDAYHVYVTNLWNDREHYKPEACFWNVRIWRWNGNTKWKEKPLHCGLAPEWAYFYHRFAPFLLLHTGLMTKESRQRKITRYNQYDPLAQHMEKKYYIMLTDDNAKPFIEADLCRKIEKEVETYKQTKPRGRKQFAPPIQKYAYVRNPGGKILPIPERDLRETLARNGFQFIEWIEKNPVIEEEVVPVEANPLQCAICGHVAKTKSALTTHKKSHI